MEATLSRREGVVVGFFWIVVVAVALMTVYQVSTGGAARTEQDEHPEAEAETATLENKIANLRAAVQVNPKDLRSLVTLGDTYLDARRGQAALQVFQQAETLAPNDTHILSDLGTIYQQVGQSDEALAKFLRVVELDPDQVGARVHIALIYQAMGQTAKALETLEAALALNPEPRYANMIRSQIQKLESEPNGK